MTRGCALLGLTRPQSSLLRKERSARGDGKEDRGETSFLPSPFLLPITPRASLLSQERRLGTSQLKECILFEIFLQFSLPPLPPYTKLKLGKNYGYTFQHCLRGEGRGWTCVHWKTPPKRESVPRLLSMIVGLNFLSAFAKELYMLKS